MAKVVIDNFLKEFNAVLSEAHNTLTCKDIRNTYIHLTNTFKEYFGGKSNLSGFTEALLFKVIEGWLSANDSYLSVSSGGFLDGKRTYCDKKGFTKTKRQQSDIKIVNGNTVKHYFSVKAITVPQKVKVDNGDLNSEIVSHYFQGALNNSTEIPLALQDFNRIENVRHSQHRNFNAITVYYTQPNATNVNLINRIKKEHSWYDYICLNDGEYENRLFVDVLNEKMSILPVKNE